jgi:hypothetical protein
MSSFEDWLDDYLSNVCTTTMTESTVAYHINKEHIRILEASEKATLERVKKGILELKRDPIVDYDDLTINTIVYMIGLAEMNK